MTDKEFIQWIHDRLQFVHHENENMDYMHKLRAFIAAMPDEITTLNVASLTAPAAPHAQAEPVDLTAARAAFDDRHCGYEFPSSALRSGALDEFVAGWKASRAPVLQEAEQKCTGCDPAEGFCKDCREAEPVGYVVDNDKGESIINVSLPVGTQVFTQAVPQEAEQAAPAAVTATHGPVGLTNRKTADIATRGYNIVGYVLRSEGGAEVCISAESAVRWLPQADYWRLMHEQDGSLFAQPAAPAATDAARDVLADAKGGV